MGEKIPFFLDSPGDCVTDRRWRSSFSFKTCRLVRGSHVVQIGGRRGGLAGQNFRAEARESPRKPRDRGSDGRANTWALAESSQGIERERERAPPALAHLPLPPPLPALRPSCVLMPWDGNLFPLCHVVIALMALGRPTLPIHGE